MYTQQNIREILRSFNHKTAIEENHASVSYAELLEGCTKVSHFLASRFAGQARIGICVKSVGEMVCAMLGCITARCVFVPLDAALPEKRFAALLREAKLDGVITGGATGLTSRLGEVAQVFALGEILAQAPAEAREVPPYADDDDLYIYFTSGSTGTPKGIIGKNASLWHFLQWEIKAFRIGEGWRFSQFISPYFDAFLRDVFVPLLTGGTICVPPRDSVFTPQALPAWVDDNGINFVHCVPSVFRVLNQPDLSPDCFSELRYVLMSGERIIASQLENWYRTFGDRVQLVNLYGLTEATMISAYYKIQPADCAKTKIPIGGPIDDTQLVVLDAQGRHCAPLGAGDLYIVTDYLSKGYLNAPALQRERFVTLPDGGRPAFKTGDRARVLVDGTVDLLGRNDRQIKLRGIRVELDEVEEVLAAHPAVKHAVVVHDSDSESLKAFVTLQPGVQNEAIVIEIENHLAASLPQNIVPAGLRALPEFPQLSNGKIDYKKLLAYNQGEAVCRPADPVEEKILSIWKEILGVDAVSTDRKFHAAGGNSLSLMRLIPKMFAEFGVRITLVELFMNLTIGKQALLVKEKVKKITFEGTDFKGQELLLPRASGSDSLVQPERRWCPLTSSQKRLYFLTELNKSSLTYNMPQVIRLEGQWQKEQLEEVFRRLIERHESLRTSFALVEGQPAQRIHHAFSFCVDCYQAEESQIKALLTKVIRPFDLSQAPLIRAALISVAEGYQLLVTDLHHIIADGESQRILTGEFQAMLQGETLPAIRATYKDFAVWQNKPEQQALFKQQESYWLNQLQGTLPVLTLPTDFERKESTEERGGIVSVYLPAAVYAQVQAYCHDQNVMPAVLLYTLFTVVMGKVSGQDDVVMGFASRGRSQPDLDGIIGMFVNTLALRTFPGQNKLFSEYLREVGVAVTKALDHQDCEFDAVVRALRAKHELGRNPIFDVMVNYIGSSDEVVDIETEPVDDYFSSVRTKRFDLTLSAMAFSNTLALNLQYDAGLFEAATARAFLQYLVNAFCRMDEFKDKRLHDVELVNAGEICRAMEQITAFADRDDTKVLTPASYHQERLWFIDKFEAGCSYKGSPVYHNIPLVIDFDGPLEVPKVEAVLQRALDRHAALRTVIKEVEARPYQHVLAEADFRLRVVEVDGSKDPLEPLVSREVQIPFVLDQLLVRGVLFKAGPAKHKLVVTVHHLVADRFSIDLLSAEIIADYQRVTEGRTPVPGKPKVSHAAFSTWQSACLGELDAHYYSFWKLYLKKNLQPLELPTDRPRALVHTYAAGEEQIHFDAALYGKLVSYARNKGVDVGLLLLSAFKILLHKYTGQREIVIGTSTDNRVHPLLREVVGPLANLIVLRSFINPDDHFDAVTERIGEDTRRARAYGQLPFDKLVRAISPAKNMSRTALFDVLFEYRKQADHTARAGDVRMGVPQLNAGYGKYDYNLFLHDNGTGISGTLAFNLDYFDRQRVGRLVRHYHELLHGLLDCPAAPVARIDLSTPEERDEVLAKARRAADAYYPADQTILDLFERQVLANPGRVAVECQGESLTYAELDRWSTGIGRLLREQGARPNRVVSLLADRSVETVVGMLGILKAGAAYLPIDVDYPAERIEYLLRDSGTDILLTTGEKSYPCHLPTVAVADGKIAGGPGAELPPVNQPSDLCYVIYTSGTTGNPKGVMVEHRNVVQLLFNDQFRFDFGRDDVWTMFHSPAFDFSVWEMYGALLYGGKVVIVPRRLAQDPRLFLQLLADAQVTVLSQTPSAFYNLVSEDQVRTGRALGLRYVHFAGEELSPARLKPWKAKYPEVRLINLYGITETTVHVTYKEITATEIAGDIRTIGGPLPTLSLYLFDAGQQLVPPGTVGEIVVGGAGVTRGYLNKEALTRERFIANPYNPAERLYRSGDRGRTLPNGEIEYLGRSDNQLKIRGFRIEAGEIENQLRSHPDVLDAVVTAREQEGEKVLAAYYRAGREIAAAEIRRFLAGKLPEHMVPAYYVPLDSFPLTLNGKLDVKALPAPAVAVHEEFVAPSVAAEEKLAAIWAEVLKTDPQRISVNRNFFDLGGDSIRLIHVAGKIREVFNTEISVATLFNAPTIAALAVLLGDASGAAGQPMEVEIEEETALRDESLSLLDPYE